MRLEAAAGELDGLMLTGAALVLVIVGLMLWLGGRQYAAIVSGALGAAVTVLAGATVTRMMSYSHPAVVPAAAVVGALFGVMLRKLVMFTLAAAILATLAAGVYLGHTMDSEAWNQQLDQSQQEAASGDADSISERTDLSEAQKSYIMRLWQVRDQFNASGGDTAQAQAVATLKTLWAEVRLAAATRPWTLGLWVVLGAVVGIVLGKVLGWVMMAMCCSVVGTAMIAVGMIALLLAKGTPAISAVASRGQFMLMVFGVMVVFGWLCQLLLAGKKKVAVAADDEDE